MRVYKETDEEAQMNNGELSDQTLKRAYTLAKCADRLDIRPTDCLFNVERMGDAMYFLFSSTKEENKIVTVLCCPSCYLVTYCDKDSDLDDPDIEYLIVKNINTFLQKLKKMGFIGASIKDIKNLIDKLSDGEDFEVEEIDEDDLED